MRRALYPLHLVVAAFLSLFLLVALPTSASSSLTPPGPQLRVYQPTFPVGVDLRTLSREERSAHLRQVASVPLKGWNSYDAFGGSVNETLIRRHIDIIARDFLPLGYSVVAVDAGWYSSNGSMLLDDYGRPQVDPLRYPSAANQQGFKAVADYAHSKGLLFGIHTMVSQHLTPRARIHPRTHPAHAAPPSHTSDHHPTLLRSACGAAAWVCVS